MIELKKCGLASEHAIDNVDFQTLRKIPFVGKVCLDMIAQARDGANTKTAVDLLKVTEDELDDAVYGKEVPNLSTGNPDDIVDPDDYLESEPEKPRALTPKDDHPFYYDDENEELVMRVPMPPRHADWLQRLSDLAININEPKVAKLYTPEMLVRKFILDARLQDKTDAGRRSSASSMQQLPAQE